MPSWREQSLIEAPVGAVWEVVADPARYPEWAGDVVEVTGLAEVAEQATFEQVSRTPLGVNTTTTFEIEKLDDLREIRLRCQQSGYYSRWLLTPAQRATFIDLEIGIEPAAPQYRLLFGLVGKRFMRRVAESSLEGLRRVLRPVADARAGHGT
jgi:hypothetical protein